MVKVLANGLMARVTMEIGLKTLGTVMEYFYFPMEQNTKASGSTTASMAMVN